MSKICCFTGHRFGLKLDYGLMDRVIENLLKGGCKKFLCGMARGFDLAAAESLLEVNKKGAYGAELVACIPCENQTFGYSGADRERYQRILRQCGEVISFAKEYDQSCMFIRDRFMAENSDTVVCYLRRKRGGTFYTVAYARKLGKKIIEL